MFRSVEQQVDGFELPTPFASGVERERQLAGPIRGNRLSGELQRRAPATAPIIGQHNRMLGFVGEPERQNGDFTRMQTPEPNGIRPARFDHFVRYMDNRTFPVFWQFRNRPVFDLLRRVRNAGGCRQQQNDRQGSDYSHRCAAEHRFHIKPRPAFLMRPSAVKASTALSRMPLMNVLLPGVE